MQAKRLLEDGCTGFLASVLDKEKEGKMEPNDVAIVREFLEVFSEELPGQPPEREISFGIKLIPGTELISKAPYQMAPA